MMAGLIGLLITILAGADRLFGYMRPRVRWLVIGALLISLVAMDHHRLQPWVYQSILYCVLFATMDRRGQLGLARWLTASIYVYSAAGKLDFQFVHTVGQEFLTAMPLRLGTWIATLDEVTRVRLAFLMPISEMTIGLLLLVPVTRKWAGMAAITLHATLIVLLGPWNLNHSYAVLVWNCLLAIQAHALFVAGRQTTDNSKTETQSTHSLGWIGVLTVLIALVMPLFERSGYWDHWTSWSLYSPHTSRVLVDVHESASERLPPHVRECLAESSVDGGWKRLDLAAWSLSSRSVPIYPQARYQLRLADRMAREFDLGPAIRVTVQSVSDRWTGKRSEKQAIGAEAIEKLLDA